MRLWKESLLARLLSYFLLLAIIPLAVVGALAYNQGQKALERRLLNHLTTAAILKEGEINRWVEDKKSLTRLLARDYHLREHAETLLTHDETSNEFASAYQTLKSYLDSILAEKTGFLEIFVIRGVGGEVVLSTNSEHEGNYEVTSTFFVEGRKTTYVQNVYSSASLGKLAMTIATPLRGKGGQTLGVLAVHLNLAKLDDIMLERGGLGVTGETYLVDRFNVFVSEARFGDESFPRGVHTQGIDTALLEKVDGAGVYTNYRDVLVIGAYRWLDDREMALLAEIELDEALAPVRGLAWAIFLVGSIAAGLVAVIAYGVARRISGPILALTESSAQMASGDLSRTVDIQRDDEIGVLARAFNSMTVQLRDLIDSLERRVAERTAELARRAEQLQAVAEVSRTVGSVLDIDELLNMVVNRARERFDLYYVGVFLVDEAREYAWLRAGTGEAGKEMLARQHKLAIGGTSMVGWCVQHEQARIALDVGEEAVRFENPLLPRTRSEMALPLTTRGEVVGALTVQSDQPQAFSEADVTVLQTMADQLANAIGNVRLYEEAQRALAEVRRAQRRYLREAWDSYIQEYEEPTGYLVAPDGVRAVDDWLTPEMRQAVAEQRLVTTSNGETTKRAALAVPLKLREEIIGVLDLYHEGASRTWTDDDRALVEVVTEQLALALENARLFDQTQGALSLSERLYEASRKITEAEGTTRISQVLVEECMWYGTADRVTVMMAGPKTVFAPEYLEVVTSWRRAGGEDPAVIGKRYQVDEFTIIQALTPPTEPVIFHDIATDARVDDTSRHVWGEQLGMSSMTAIPLASGVDWFGLVIVQTRAAHTFGEEEIRFYRSLADRAAVAMQTQRLLQVTASRARREHMTREIATKIRESVDMDVIMQTAVVELGQALGAQTFIRLGETEEEK